MESSVQFILRKSEELQYSRGKAKAIKEKYVGLFEEFQKEKGGLAVDFDALYLIAYK